MWADPRMPWGVDKTDHTVDQSITWQIQEGNSINDTEEALNAVKLTQSELNELKTNELNRVIESYTNNDITGWKENVEGWTVKMSSDGFIKRPYNEIRNEIFKRGWVNTNPTHLINEQQIGSALQFPAWTVFKSIVFEDTYQNWSIDFIMEVEYPQGKEGIFQVILINMDQDQ